ncbi:hypothetical protein TNCV_278481 [Trichonephila clavipes]|nr:hypothetical protein TNCV_278481 [Trichonephila clavipes]
MACGYENNSFIDNEFPEAIAIPKKIFVWRLPMERLDTCQNQISEQLLGTEDAVQEYLDDMEDAENYRDRYIEICTRVDLKIRETVGSYRN